MKCLNHCHNIIKSSKKGSFILNNCWKYEKNSTKKLSFNNEIKSQERPRMQDLAPFIPELLGALIGPHTPSCTGPRRGRRQHQFACYFSIFFCYFKIYWHPWYHINTMINKLIEPTICILPVSEAERQTQFLQKTPGDGAKRMYIVVNP